MKTINRVMTPIQKIAALSALTLLSLIPLTSQAVPVVFDAIAFQASANVDANGDSASDFDSGPPFDNLPPLEPVDAFIRLLGDDQSYARATAEAIAGGGIIRALTATRTPDLVASANSSADFSGDFTITTGNTLQLMVDYTAIFGLGINTSLLSVFLSINGLAVFSQDFMDSTQIDLSFPVTPGSVGQIIILVASTSMSGPVGTSANQSLGTGFLLDEIFGPGQISEVSILFIFLTGLFLLILLQFSRSRNGVAVAVRQMTHAS